jgi:hypothetical protein
VEEMAQKILKSTHAALKLYLSGLGVDYTEQRQKAMDAFLWWGD